MPREKFHTLTEQMFYILLALRTECCGMDIMDAVSDITDGRVVIGPGTLYNLLEKFKEESMITETRAEGRRRYYLLTETGKSALESEFIRLQTQSADYQRLMKEDEDG